MSDRSPLIRSWQATVFLAALIVIGWTLLYDRQLFATSHLYLYAVLVAVAMLVRVERGSEHVGFEAAIVFAAVILHHDPGMALLPVFLGGLLAEFYRASRVRRFSLTRFYAASRLALAYWFVALLYTSAVDRAAGTIAKISGFAMLVIAYLGIRIGLIFVRRWLDRDANEVQGSEIRTVALAEVTMLGVIIPAVAINVMLASSYGDAGFAVGLVPLVLVAEAMRRLQGADSRNDELQRQNRELALLTESATQILAAEGNEETLRRLTTLLSKLARMKACAMVTWEMNPDIPGTVYRFGECLPTDQDILRWVDSAGFSQSAPSRAFVFRNELRRFPLSSGDAIQVLIGIQTGEVIYGILIFETEETSILRSGSLNLLTLLVSQTALSLQDQLLRREMREKTQLLEAQAVTNLAIRETSSKLLGSFDVDANLTTIAQAVRESTGFENVVFALYDPKSDTFIRRAHAGLEHMFEEMRRKPVPAAEIREFMNDGFAISHSYFVPHTALRQGDGDLFVVPGEEEPLLIDDAWHVNDLLLVPLSNEQLIGYLSVKDPQDHRVPSIEKVRTLEIFALLAVQALRSAGQYDEIKRLTTIDALTPAFNHRYFQEALAKEINRHTRTQHEFALAMIDIDNFKKINDTFGHPIGDEVLRGLVDELMRNARDSDVVSRYGGEEFAIIFPETSRSAARDAANRMRDLIERREFPMPALGRKLRITVSIGVAIFSADARNSAELVSRADMALYEAKRSGKNRVVMASELSSAAASR